MIKMLLVILLVALNAQAYNPPPEDPICESPWEVWYVSSPECSWCSEYEPKGTWIGWYCTIHTWSNFHQMWYLDVKMVSTCEYPDQSTSTGPFDVYVTFIPIAQSCERDAITGVCPVASSIRP